MKVAIQLRDYQEAARDAIFQAHREGVTRPLACLPTGTGKTVLFGAVAKDRNTKTLVLAHRDELLNQAIEKISLVWPEASFGRVKADENDFQKQVVCASVQTLARPNRLEQVAHAGFETLIVDEAHHAAALSYRRILDYLGFMDGDPVFMNLGVTATASRGDGIALGHVFEKIVYQVSILTMIRAGYLSDIRAFRITTGTDLGGVGIRNGDFIEGQLAAVVNTPERNQAVVDAYLEHAAGRKAIAFAVDVAHAEDLAETFRSNGVEAEAVSGKTPDDERKEILARFRAGEIQVLTNCAVLTEGYDEPAVSCILMARPTKSKTLYIQCIGRGTRLFPGKTDCIVLDFTDSRHDVCSLPTLVGKVLTLKQGQSVREAIAEAIKEKREWALPPAGPVKIMTQEIDLLGRSQFRWFQAGKQWRLPVAPGLYVVLSPEGEKYRVILAGKGKDGENINQHLHPVALPVGYAQGVAEDYARANARIFASKNATWRRQPPSEKQVELAKRLGLCIDGMSKGDVSDLFEQFFANRKA